MSEKSDEHSAHLEHLLRTEYDNHETNHAFVQEIEHYADTLDERTLAAYKQFLMHSSDAEHDLVVCEESALDALLLSLDLNPTPLQRSYIKVMILRALREQQETRSVGDVQDSTRYILSAIDKQLTTRTGPASSSSSRSFSFRIKKLLLPVAVCALFGTSICVARAFNNATKKSCHERITQETGALAIVLTDKINDVEQVYDKQLTSLSHETSNKTEHLEEKLGRHKQKTKKQVKKLKHGIGEREEEQRKLEMYVALNQRDAEYGIKMVTKDLEHEREVRDLKIDFVEQRVQENKDEIEKVGDTVHDLRCSVAHNEATLKGHADRLEHGEHMQDQLQEQVFKQLVGLADGSNGQVECFNAMQSMVGDMRQRLDKKSEKLSQERLAKEGMEKMYHEEKEKNEVDDFTKTCHKAILVGQTLGEVGKGVHECVKPIVKVCKMFSPLSFFSRN